MATYELRKVSVTTDLAKFAMTVLPEDMQRSIQIVYSNELELQRRIGQKPTTELIDNGRTQLFNVKRRAQAFFSSPDRMKAATREAWDMLISRTRIKSGAARKSYFIYVNQRPIAGIDALETIVKAMKPTDFISVVGPGVAYGRKLYWRPFGKARKIKKKAAKYTTRGGETVIVRAVYTEPMHRAVQRVLARKYPDLIISDGWTPLLHGDGKRGERWPTITIRIKSSRNSVLH